MLDSERQRARRGRLGGHGLVSCEDPSALGEKQGYGDVFRPEGGEPVLDPVLARFVDLLEPGGHLCVVDLVEEDGSFHEGGDFDGHNGFDIADLAQLLRAAGFAESEFAQVYEVAKREKSYPLFLATCRKPG